MNRARGHPLARLAGTVGRLPRYLNLAQGLVRDPAVPVHAKAALAAGIGYCVSPFDLIPGIIPLLGQLDDLAALLMALRLALRAGPAAVSAQHLARVGLSTAALDADLRTVVVATAWLAGRAARLGRAAVRGSGWLLGQAVRRLQTQLVHA